MTTTIDRPTFLVWVDLETTGLDPSTDQILEVGMIITTTDLDELGRWSWVCEYPPWLWPWMEADVMAMHQRSGLLGECAHPSATTPGAALHAALGVLNDLVPDSSQRIMAGSGLHFDRRFLANSGSSAGRSFLDRLHYRVFDVRAFLFAAEWWGGAAADTMPIGQHRHRAIPDLEDSIAVARWAMDRSTPDAET